jgi:hypothetical protein
MASTQRVIKTRWGVNLNEVTLYKGNIPAAVTYTVTSQRSGEVRTFGQRPIARAESGFESSGGSTAVLGRF